MKRVFFVLILTLNFTGVIFSKSKIKLPEGETWSRWFANAVISRHDSLIYYNFNKPKYEYDFAFLGTAMSKLQVYDQKYFDSMKAYIDYFVDNKGNISGYKLTDYNMDRVRPGFDMLELYSQTKNEKYRIAAEMLVRQMESQPRTESRGFWHKKIYPYQMWLDGLYMAEPFLARYARDFNQPKWFDEAVFQLNLVYEKNLQPQTGLLVHAWDESRKERWCQPETGQSKHCWSRGTGWYVMALVDVLDYLPENHQGRNLLISILNKLSESLKSYRDPKTGLWYQVVEQKNREGNYLEASGSAMIIYAWAKGAAKGYLPKAYGKLAIKSFDGLVNNLVVVDKDGYPTLKNVCGGCGLGGNPYREADYNYYINEKRVDNDQKGIAALIMAALELGR